MKKIENVIESCYQCQYCLKLKGENHTKAYICDYSNEDQPIDLNFKPFLIDLDHSSGTNILEIPDNCPLETYED